MTNNDLEKKLRKVIETLSEIVEDEEAPPYVRVNAGSKLGTAIKQYQEQFGTADPDQTKLKSIKDF